MAPVDVVVPVYRGAAATRRCIDSVLASMVSRRHEVVVVDDASPDPEVVGYLDTLADGGRITLLRNETNLGFVASVNRAMSLHPERDVVLLNSDTEVANDWLDRLAACAYSASDVGTATPFSNNATICSYPYRDWPGGVPGGLGLAGLDRLVAAVNRGRSVEVPTAVGFCMYIRRACLDAVGLFDVERFGRGYGEENDFCMRASAAGWRHLLVADLFVFHQGAVSFADDRHALQERAMKVLLEAHPDYQERVERFLASDPPAPERAAIDAARLALGGEERRQVLLEQLGRLAPGDDGRPVRLHVTHGWGGGTARWVRDFCRADGRCRHLLLRSQSDRNHTGRWLELVDAGADELQLIRWELATPIDGTAICHAQYLALLESVIEGFGVGAVVVSSLIGHSLAALGTRLPTVVVWHDLYPFCPALFASFDAPCTSCQPDRLAACMVENPHNCFWHNTEAADWLALRETYGQALARPWVRIVAPSADVHRRWAALLPAVGNLPWTLVPHGIDDPGPLPARTRAAGGDRPLRIVIPGRLLPHKGLNLLAEALDGLQGQVEILLLGCGEFGASFASRPGVRVVADYRHQDLAAHVGEFDPDVAFLLSVLPESFSYTLSEFWAMGVPVAATRLGAFAERIGDGVTGLLFDPSPPALIDCVRRLAENRSALERLRETIATMPRRDAAAMVADYHQLLPVAQPHRPTVIDLALSSMAHDRLALERENAELKASMTAAAAALDEARLMRAELGDRLAEQTRLNGELLASRSWAATGPLRAAARLARGWRNRLRGWQVAGPVAPVSVPRGEIPAAETTVTDPRTQLRRAMDVPDRTQVILLLPETPAAAEWLPYVAHGEAARLGNGRVIWIPDAMKAQVADASPQGELAVLLACRRLFVGDFGLAPSDWEAAADRVIRPAR